MSRIKRFMAEVEVTHELMVEAKKGKLEAEISDRLEEQLSGELVGPRGGKYEPVGPIEYLGSAQTGDNWMRNTWTFAARRQGKYVKLLPRVSRDAANRLGEALG